MISKLYRCPCCDGKIRIDAFYDEDEEYGPSVVLEVFCPKCRDRRVDELVKTGLKVERLVAFLGAKEKE